MTSRLKIDLTQGTLDVEGSEKFVREIYKEFKDRIDQGTKTTASRGTKKTSTSGKKRGRKPGRKRTTTREPQLIADLNLKPKGKKSLSQVYNSYKKLNRNEKFVLYLDYLYNTAGVKKVSIDHLYTCMKEVGDPAPKLFKQTLSNCKNQTGWVDTSDFDNIKLTAQGKKHLSEKLKQKQDSSSASAKKSTTSGKKKSTSSASSKTTKRKPSRKTTPKRRKSPAKRSRSSASKKKSPAASSAQKPSSATSSPAKSTSVSSGSNTKKK